MFLEWKDSYERVIDNYCKGNIALLDKEPFLNKILLNCYAYKLDDKIDFNELRVFEPVEVNNQLQVAYYGSEKEECFGVLTNYLMDDNLTLTAGYLLNNKSLLVGSFKSRIIGDFNYIEVPKLTAKKGILFKHAVVSVDNWKNRLENLEHMFDKKETFVLANLINYLTE